MTDKEAAVVTMTNVELQQAVESLRELSQERLPVAGALRIRQVIREVQAHLDDMEEVRKQLLSRHARKGDDGTLVLDERGSATFEDGELQQFQADYTELMTQTVEVEHTVRVSDLGSIELKPSTLVGLGALLEEEG